MNRAAVAREIMYAPIIKVPAAQIRAEGVVDVAVIGSIGFVLTSKRVCIVRVDELREQGADRAWKTYANRVGDAKARREAASKLKGR